ncbi:tetratricopeptide repeat protein [Patescibacteria group bacterium]|nr:tetratricopeptide repeat protein [Patescibacteria group bacterium]
MFQLIPKEHRGKYFAPATEKPVSEPKKIKTRKIYLAAGNFWPAFLRRLMVFFVLATLAVFLIHSASAVNQDLGRHLKVGEIIWQTKQVPSTNLFSYTNSDWPFINHHWLSEVIYYLLSLAIGIKGLIIFNALIILAAFALVWRLAWRKDYFIASTLAAMLGAGLILERTDIRPETFGLLLLALFLVILAKNKEKISWHFWLLIPLELLWVNLHISFIYGLVLIFFFFLDRLWSRRRAVYLLARQKKLERYMAQVVLLGLLAGAAALVNPNAWRGALYPLYIFGNYGYTIVENQSPFFLAKLMSNPTIIFFKVSLLALAIAFLMNLGRLRLFYLLSALLLVGMSWGAIRNFPLLGLIILPVLTDNFVSWREHFSRYFVKWEGRRWRGALRLLTIAVIFVILSTSIYAVATNRFYRDSLKPEQFGLGVPVGAGAAVDFLKQNKIVGPMFNNFDIGSYLIWRLYPEQLVFVDGRPEAYPMDFFQSIYIPMQTDNAVWQKYADEVYKINLVFFAHTDGTPWGQEFLRQMAQRKGWAMVYLDPTVVIWARDNAVNQDLISRFALSENNLGQSIAKYLVANNFFDAVRLGSFFQVVGFNDLALQSFDRALQLNQDAKQIWFISGTLYSLKNQAGQAEAYLKKAIELDQGYIDAYLSLGKIYYEQGNFSEARRAWQRVLEIEPGNEAARAYLDNMGLIPFKK